MTEPLSGEFAHAAAKPVRFTNPRPVSVGGMGIVERVYDTVLQRDVACKRPRPDVAHAGERLQREATMAARFHHANIIAVHDVGEDDDGLFVVMPWVDGARLSDVISDRRRALNALVQACQGVAHAHAQGVVHRDLKPSNVLVADRAVVIDWGLAVQPDATDERLTRTGMHVGTPGYAAPEQLLGHPVSPASDVWSLGAMLWQILTGLAPHAPETQPSLDQRVLSGAYAPLTGPLGLIANRALASDPAVRFEHAGQLADALQVALRPVPTTQNRVLPALFGGASMAVLAACTAAWWGLVDRQNAAPAGPDVRADYAWMLLHEGQVDRAISIGSATGDASWDAVPRLTAQSEVVASCSAFDMFEGYAACTSEGTVRHGPIDQPFTHSVPARGLVGAHATGLWRGDEERFIWSYNDSPRGGSLSMPVQSAIPGDSSAVVVGGDTAVLMDLSTRPSTSYALDIHQPRGTFAYGSYYLFSHWGEPIRVGPRGQVTPLDLPTRDGAVVAVGRVGDGLAAVWDRGLVVRFDPDGTFRHSFHLPYGVKVHGAAMNDDLLVIATARHGVLVFEPSGGLLGQLVSDRVSSVYVHDGAIWTHQGQTVRRWTLDHDGPVAWFHDAPVTAIAMHETLTSGDANGRVRRFGVEPATFERLGNVVRSLWIEDDAVVANIIGAPHLRRYEGDTVSDLPPTSFKLVAPLGEGYVAAGWLNGLIRLSEQGVRGDDWWAPSDVIVDLDTHGHDEVVALTRNGALLRAAVGQGVRRIGDVEAPRAVAFANDNLWIGARDEVSFWVDGEVRWRAPVPDSPSAVASNGSQCVAGSRAGTLMVFDCASGEVLAEFDAHRETVSDIVVTDEAVVSASYDGTVRRWLLDPLSR